MGREQPTIVLQPHKFRKDARAKKARATVHKDIPKLLASNPRARRGVEAAELIVDPPPCKPPPRKKEQTVPTNGHTLQIRVMATDTLAAAAQLSKHAPSNTGAPNVAILNMASPLVPGGGFLNGANSQEEFLCLRTTLYPSLRDEFYRLPEVGGVWTPDVLVWRDSGAEARELGRGEKGWVDVVSAGMLRFPEVEWVEGDAGGEEREGEGGGGRFVYAQEKDREMVVRKMRAVMRILVAKGARRVVLGAWGCNAYGNPVGEVARAWKKVLLGSGEKRRGRNSGTETWDGIEEVVFAIKDRRMAEEFEKVFGVRMTLGPGQGADAASDVNDDEVSARAREEIRAKVADIENQIPQVRNPVLKARLQAILDDLRRQLANLDDAGGNIEGGSESAEEKEAEDDSFKSDEDVEDEPDDEEDVVDSHIVI